MHGLLLGTENESRRHANKVPSLAVLDLAEIQPTFPQTILMLRGVWVADLKRVLTL